MNQLSIYKLQKLKNSLSHDRIHTYENLTDSNGAKVKLNYSFELYEWNAKVSALFLLPLHVCEVVIRNAVAESIERKYGTSWEKNNSFIITLTSSYQKELRNISKKYSTTGKVVAAMNFIFWQTMFTSRFDTTILLKMSLVEENPLQVTFLTTLLLFYLPAWLVYVFFAIFEN